MKQQMPSKSHHPVQDLEPEDIQCLGECVRDLVAHLGYGTHAGTLEAGLFREAIDSAVYILTGRQGMRASLQDFREQRGYGPPEYLPITMEELAQQIIIHSDEERRSVQEMRSRVQFALKLDSTCVEAYLLEGYIEERQAHDQKALAAYQRALQLSTEKLGPDAFEEETRKKQQIHFWHSTGTRPYMQARAALAYLLWRKLGKRQEAIDHFRALLSLNPGDNQGNRYAIICCLLEEGDDEALGEALQRYFLYTDEYGEEMDLRETCWWYTNACWKFLRASREQERSSRQAASKALRTAFTYNQHVPYFLLHPEALTDFGEPDSYAHGDKSEAAWYASFVLKAWRQTPGALDWLEASAKRAGLLV
jgi:tetratricopeptide (TPR) repeat protein